MRVIAGTLGGRRLVAPAGSQTRPTSDRVREALFSALGSSLNEARVLDAYAGSGALGIEALSRGAQSAVFIERARPALKALRQNVVALGLTPVTTTLACSVERAAQKLRHEGPFDVLFADPPYAELAAAVSVLNSWLQSPGIVASSGIVVLEHAARDAPPSLAGMEVTRTRRYGDTAVTFLGFLEI